jgi:hypothetical protein
MECIAIGSLKGSKVEWHVPSSNSFMSLFNINDKIIAFQKELLEICDNLEPYTCEFTEVLGYYLAVIKTENDCCMVACDTKLSDKEMYYLASWVLKIGTLEIIAQNMTTFTQKDPKIHHVQQELHETTKLLHKDIDLLLQRDQNLNQLVDRTKTLKIDAFLFKEKTKKSCWPDCNLF